MGSSTAGLTTKIHVLSDARGLPIKFLLAPGQAHDLPGADTLLTNLCEGDTLLGGKAYDADYHVTLKKHRNESLETKMYSSSQNAPHFR